MGFCYPTNLHFIGIVKLKTQLCNFTSRLTTTVNTIQYVSYEIIFYNYNQASPAGRLITSDTKSWLALVWSSFIPDILSSSS